MRWYTYTAVGAELSSPSVGGTLRFEYIDQNTDNQLVIIEAYSDSSSTLAANLNSNIEIERIKYGTVGQTYRVDLGV